MLNFRTRLQEKNFARNKTKQVAWFVSNCGARYRIKKYKCSNVHIAVCATYIKWGTNATLKCKVVVQMQLRALQLVQIWYTAFKTTKTNFTFPKMGRFSLHLVFSLL